MTRRKKHLFSNETLAQMFEQMQTVMIVTDQSLNIVYLNNAAEILLLTSKAQILQHTITQFFTEDISLKTLAKRCISTKQVFSLSDISLVIKNDLIAPKVDSTHEGYNRLVDLAVTPMNGDYQNKTSQNKTSQSKTSQKNLVANLLLFEIHTKGQQSEIAKQESQREQQKITRELIRSIAHEVKNPLASIRGAAQLIQMSGLQLNLPKEINEELTEYTNVMIKESDRLKNLADAMLGSNKLMDKKISNIHEPLEHVMTLIKSQYGQISLVRDYDISLPELLIDKNRMIQVFLNITLNAAQALTASKNSVKSPCICLKTRVSHHKIIMGTAYKKAVKISITDNGVGIPKKVQKTLFYPMVSARKGGTGLGLSIAQEIVRHHDGEISCDSKAGKTVFTIYLPLEP